MLGISTYLQDLDVNYLKAAAEIGAKYVFTSLHIPEEDFSDIDVKLPLLLKTCQELDMTLVPDVSPVTFEKLGVKAGDMESIKQLGIKALRLDYGFDDVQQLIELQKDFELMLNASVVSKDFLEKAQKAGLDLSKVEMAHNFYPKVETGLSKVSFEKTNQTFEGFGTPLLTFVPGDKKKRFPLYQGLPTIENHRGKHPFVAAVELIQRYGVRDIIIGDSEARLSTLQMIQSYMADKVLTLPVFFEDKELYGEFGVRRDIPERVIRLATPRIPEIEIKKSLDRKKGMITQENLLGGRYSGEIQLCKEALPYSSSSNVLGFIHPEFVELLDYIDSQTRIKFVSIEEI